MDPREAAAEGRLAALHGECPQRLLNARETLRPLFTRLRDARLLHESVSPELAVELGATQDAATPDAVLAFLATCPRPPEDPIPRQWLLALRPPQVRLALASPNVSLPAAAFLLLRRAGAVAGASLSKRAAFAHLLVAPDQPASAVRRFSWTAQQATALLFRGVPRAWLSPPGRRVPELYFADEREALEIEHALIEIEAAGGL